MGPVKCRSRASVTGVRAANTLWLMMLLANHCSAREPAPRGGARTHAIRVDLHCADRQRLLELRDPLVALRLGRRVQVVALRDGRGGVVDGERVHLRRGVVPQTVRQAVAAHLRDGMRVAYAEEVQRDGLRIILARRSA